MDDAVAPMTQALKDEGLIRAAFRRFCRHRLALISLAALVLLIIFSAAAPLVEKALGVDANSVDLMNRFARPSTAHPMGADELGRDFFVRLLYGGRVSLFVGFTTAAVAAIIGAMVGLVAGYHGGMFDAVLMRIADSVIALPLLPLLIVLAAVDLEKAGIPQWIIQSEKMSLYRITAIVALVGWPTAARLARGAALSLREHEFVLAAKAQGAGAMRIMLVHILPNLISPIIVSATLSAGSVILFESVLSFLGLGIQPPVPSWGNLLTNAQELIWDAPRLAVYPGLLIFITVIAFNFLGDGLQDALDPKAHR